METREVYIFHLCVCYCGFEFEEDNVDDWHFAEFLLLTGRVLLKYRNVSMVEVSFQVGLESRCRYGFLQRCGLGVEIT